MPCWPCSSAWRSPGRGWPRSAVAATRILARSAATAQRHAAEEYLAALASGDPRAMAQTIHEDELEQLRKSLLDEMKLEADRNESLVRSRLFGPACR